MSGIVVFAMSCELTRAVDATDRIKHLTTQLHWRLNEGKGTAFYEVGVRDNGDPIGISEDIMIKSVRTLARCVVAFIEWRH